MAKKQHEKKGVLIGVEGLVFAELLTDTSTGATYKADIHEVPGTIEVAMTLNISDEQLGADDNPTWEMISALDSIDVGLNIASLGKAVEALIQGHRIDANGAMISSADDVPPWLAMGFRAPRSDKSNDLIWLYKGKFKPSDVTYHTKEKGAVNWNTPNVKATFGPRDFDHSLMVSINDGDSDVEPETIETFFDAPYEPDPA